MDALVGSGGIALSPVAGTNTASLATTCERLEIAGCAGSVCGS